MQAEAIASKIAETRIIVHPGIDIGAVGEQPHIVRQVQGEFGFHALVAGISIDDQRRRALLRHRNLEILVLDKVGADAEVQLAKRALHAGFVIVEQFGREHPHVGGQHPADAAGIDLHHRRTATTRVGGIKVHVVGGAEQDVGARQEGIKSTRGTEHFTIGVDAAANQWAAGDNRIGNAGRNAAVAIFTQITAAQVDFQARHRDHRHVGKGAEGADFSRVAEQFGGIGQHGGRAAGQDRGGAGGFHHTGGIVDAGQARHQSRRALQENAFF